MDAILDLFLVHLFVDGCQEVHIYWSAYGLCLDAGLNAGKCLPLEIVGPPLKLIDEFVIFHYLHMVNLVLLIIRVNGFFLHSPLLVRKHKHWGQIHHLSIVAGL
jgi:hypothetical protein